MVNREQKLEMIGNYMLNASAVEGMQASAGGVPVPYVPL